jgi:hypothetical protein
MHLDHPAEEAPEVEEERWAVEEEAMASREAIRQKNLMANAPRPMPL